MQHIDPASLNDERARAFLDSEIAAESRARLAAGLAHGAAKRRYQRYARQHSANIKALSDRLYGPVPADIAALSDDELMSELQGI